MSTNQAKVDSLTAADYFDVLALEQDGRRKPMTMGSPRLTFTVTMMLPVWKGVKAGKFHRTESGKIWLGVTVAD